ncbi:unnamed protein product [Rotaria sp. Silwood2]|nr:unnamed protein product [Rotaria sp. Silwood2]CAF2981073.1 unnamed protein product [Rotaria sp. Silwood2]CAF3145227.1 unnamed protein product [Rotaria sp. Silwood2]CAF3990856.1 unnamed protein product [Rotaria sp. Silwood2]CAF4012587.1 unnamed protein product [Rotaria sp. Silwood2]
MCDNLSLYKTYIPSPTILSSTQSTTMAPQFYPMNSDDQQHRPFMSIKRKFSDYEDNNSSLTTLEHVSTSFDSNNSDDEDDEDDDDGSSGDDETISDDESNNVDSITRVTTPCTITQRRHSDTNHTSSSSSLSYGTPIVKRRCTYSSMHDDEQKRSVLVESYRKLRGVKKPKLQVSLLICNLIKRLEKTFTKSPPPSRQQQQQHVQYYQPRTTYRSSSSDSIYMSTSLPSSLGTDDIETTTITPINQQYSPPHTSNYDSDNVLLPVGDIRSTSSMYHPSSTDAYWLAQSNFAIPVVSTSDDDVDVSLQGGGDYLDLSDNTLASSFSSCSSAPSSVSSSSSSSSELISSSTSISNDCCCSSTSSSTMTKLLVDTNNNNNNNDDYYVYHHHHHQQQHHHIHHHAQIHSNQDLHSHHHSSLSEQAFFYHHNGNNTVDIITTA